MYRRPIGRLCGYYFIEVNMHTEMIIQPEKKLIGLAIRTSYTNELDAKTSKIAVLASKYFQNNIAEKIPERKNPGITIVAYSEYDSDEYGNYTYYIGEEVSSLNNIPKDLTEIVLPAGRYQKFTTDEGRILEVIINAWQQIWQLTSAGKMLGKRTYKVDYEVYDERANDPDHTVIDIYIGIS